MELRQLEYFVAVAEERNFTRAAARVHISQSGVSAQIRRLEHELGADLFDRSARTVTLTVAGKAALGHARAALAAADAVGRAVGEVADLIRGSLTVGMVIGCTVRPLFDALAAFHTAHPGVELALLEQHTDPLVADVRAGAVDLALIGTPTVPLDGIETMTIIREPLVAAVPPGHPLAARRPVGLADLAAHPLVCMPRGTGLRTVLDRACAAHDLEPAVAFQASAADAIADLAARGLAVAVLSASMAAAYADRLVAVPVDGLSDGQGGGLGDGRDGSADGPKAGGADGADCGGADARAVDAGLVELSLIWRPTPGPAVRALLTHARRAFAAPAARS